MEISFRDNKGESITFYRVGDKESLKQSLELIQTAFNDGRISRGRFESYRVLMLGKENPNMTRPNLFSESYLQEALDHLLGGQNRRSKRFLKAVELGYEQDEANNGLTNRNAA